MKDSTNPYIAAGRYDKLPISECIGIRASLDGLSAVSKDTAYKTDCRLRLDALDARINAV